MLLKCHVSCHLSHKLRSNTSLIIKTGASETNLIYSCSPGGTSKNLPGITQVHQKWDTPDSFDGSWACGPTSSVMALTYYKRLASHPITISSPYKHTNDYGWYVSSIYKSETTGFLFDRMQPDPKGHAAYGAYGTCTEGGGAWAWRIQQYVQNHGLSSQFVDSPISFDAIKHAIDSNWPVVLSTQLSSAGHLILVRGYYSNNQTLICNDPWGNAAAPNYGQLMNGENVHYSYSFVKAKWAVIVKPKSFSELDNVLAGPEVKQ